MRLLLILGTATVCAVICTAQTVTFSHDASSGGIHYVASLDISTCEVIDTITSIQNTNEVHTFSDYDSTYFYIEVLRDTAVLLHRLDLEAGLHLSTDTIRGLRPNIDVTCIRQHGVDLVYLVQFDRIVEFNMTTKIERVSAEPFPNFEQASEVFFCGGEGYLATALSFELYRFDVEKLNFGDPVGSFYNMQGFSGFPIIDTIPRPRGIECVGRCIEDQQLVIRYRMTFGTADLSDWRFLGGCNAWQYSSSGGSAGDLDILTYDFWLDLEASDEVCDSPDLHIVEPCRSSDVSLSSALPKSYSTALRADSCVLEIQQPTAGQTLMVSSVNPQVSVSGSGSARVVLSNTDGENLSLYYDAIRAVNYNDASGGLEPDTVIIEVTMYERDKVSDPALAYLYLGSDALSAGPDQSLTLCPDDAPTDLSTLVQPGGTWSADPLVDPVTDSTATYLYTVSSACGIDTAVITVAISPPAVDVLIDTTLCIGESIEIAGQTYEQATAFSEVVSNQQGCDSILYDVQINYLPAPETISADTSLCTGEVIMIDGIVIDRDTTIETCILNSRGCDSIIVQTVVEVAEPTEYSLSLQGDLCNGSAELVILPDDVADVAWSDSDLPTITSGGTYAATVTDASGCTTEVVTSIPPADLPTVSGQLDYVFEVDTTFVPDLVSDAVTIQWTPSTGLSCTDCLTPDITVTGDQLYTVTVTGDTGCTVSQEISIVVQRAIDPILRPSLPNVFSPSAMDPLNRAFFLQSTTIDSYDMMIYDRWGNAVFAGTSIPPGDPSLGWQGDHHGQSASPGVYVYQITYIDDDGAEEQLVGTVALVR